MLWIGLTGPMGSGKSTVAQMLRKIGYDVLDADRIVHEILSPGGKAEAQIIRTFGESVRGTDGHLDRRALGRNVFGDAAMLTLLEGILHPLVRGFVASEKASLAAVGKGIAFYDVPLLFEKKMEKDFDHVIVVTAPDEARRKRLNQRSQMTEAEFLERSKHHVSAEEKVARASFVIKNDTTLKDLEEATAHGPKPFKFTSPDLSLGVRTSSEYFKFPTTSASRRIDIGFQTTYSRVAPRRA